MLYCVLCCAVLSCAVLCNQLIKALATKCHALIILSREEGTSSESTGADAFQSTYKELTKWEDLGKSDTNWELLVHKHNQAQRYVSLFMAINNDFLSIIAIHCY